VAFAGTWTRDARFATSFNYELALRQKMLHIDDSGFWAGANGLGGGTEW